MLNIKKKSTYHIKYILARKMRSCTVIMVFWQFLLRNRTYCILGRIYVGPGIEEIHNRQIACVPNFYKCSLNGP